MSRLEFGMFAQGPSSLPVCARRELHARALLGGLLIGGGTIMAQTAALRAPLISIGGGIVGGLLLSWALPATCRR